jgi:hypothetical protein
MVYTLEHSVKEGLVSSPLEWPGVHCAESLITGKPLEGVWFNRTKEWAARKRGESYDRYDYATRYQVGFSPLPAFREMPQEEYREKVAAEVRRIEDEYAREHQRKNDSVAGIGKILSLDPYQRPTRKPPKDDPAPPFHVSDDKLVRGPLLSELSGYLERFQDAAAKLRKRGGALSARHDFPLGSYPPALPYVGGPAPPCPPDPPTCRLDRDAAGKVTGRGPVPVVEIPGSWSSPDARGEPE